MVIVWDTELGSVYFPNITPAPETGIGNISDAEIKRALRYNIRHDGRATFPMMDFHMMSDEDLHDIIAYLRSRPAVENEVPEHDFNLMGRIVMATLIGPVDHGEDAPAESPSMRFSSEFMMLRPFLLFSVVIFSKVFS